MEKLSDKNPCKTFAVDRQIGNPYRHQCECDRCLKPDRWKDECVEKLSRYEGVLCLPDVQNAKYADAIQLACEELIKHPDCLKAVLIQYDSLVKQQAKECENMELPYWCYGWWGSGKEQ